MKSADFFPAPVCCSAASRRRVETVRQEMILVFIHQTFVVCDQPGSIAAGGIIIDCVWINNQRRSYYSRRLAAEHAASLLTVSVRVCARVRV